ncbi:MAG: winged helix-turn-helix domain-containing protein [Bulleidia sp.]
MKKSGLKDMKKENLTMLVRLVQENPGISRISLSQKTGLSASTVTSLVSHLLEQNVLIENGTVSTGGRSQRRLELNPDFGMIAVFEISRRSIWFSTFDLSISLKSQQKLTERWRSGNDLLELIRNHLKGSRVLGIGLLFQDDMKESDFNVMMDAGGYAPQMKLSDALRMYLKVPVIEDYSMHYTVTQALAEEETASCCAHIMLGTEVAASITVDERTIEILPSFCRSFVPEDADAAEEKDGLEGLMMSLYMMFPLACIFISSDSAGPMVNAGELENDLCGKLENDQLKVIFVDSRTSSDHEGMARWVRNELKFS